jgi:hypothetical protein
MPRPHNVGCGKCWQIGEEQPGNYLNKHAFPSKWRFLPFLFSLKKKNKGSGDEGTGRGTDTPHTPAISGIPAKSRRNPWGKDYLFAGSDAGGRRAAEMYSLIETAKLNGVTPQAYFADRCAHPQALSA